MLVGELIFNYDFDVNCNYEVYDCTDGGKTWDETPALFSTSRDGWKNH